MKLIDDFRRIWWRLWSARLALLWGVISGLYLVWPAFQDVVPLKWFACLSMAMGGAIAVARYLKQPGIE